MDTRGDTFYLYFYMWSLASSGCGVLLQVFAPWWLVLEVNVEQSWSVLKWRAELVSSIGLEPVMVYSGKHEKRVSMARHFFFGESSLAFVRLYSSTRNPQRYVGAWVPYQMLIRVRVFHPRSDAALWPAMRTSVALR